MKYEPPQTEFMGRSLDSSTIFIEYENTNAYSITHKERITPFLHLVQKTFMEQFKKKNQVINQM